MTLPQGWLMVWGGPWEILFVIIAILIPCQWVLSQRLLNPKQIINPRNKQYGNDERYHSHYSFFYPTQDKKY